MKKKLIIKDMFNAVSHKSLQSKEQESFSTGGCQKGTL